MISKECRHNPHTSRITFDIGHGQMAVYELCKDCQKLEVFEENILNSEKIVPSQTK